MALGGWNPAVNEGDAACRHERDEREDVELDVHDEQLLDAIGDEVYANMHERGFDRSSMTTWQRINLQRALFAFMNDRLFYGEVQS